MEADNDDLHWHLEGPDTAGNVRLVWEGPGARQVLDLGPKEVVTAVYTDWLLHLDCD